MAKPKKKKGPGFMARVKNIVPTMVDTYKQIGRAVSDPLRPSKNKYLNTPEAKQGEDYMRGVRSRARARQNKNKK